MVRAHAELSMAPSEHNKGAERVISRAPDARSFVSTERLRVGLLGRVSRTCLSQNVARSCGKADWGRGAELEVAVRERR